MGLTTLWTTCVTDINYRYGQKSFYRKIKQFDFSVASLWTHSICGGCHKDITDVKDKLTAEKYDP